jgi:capsular exopolysaccharide synthesis family protein
MTYNADLSKLPQDSIAVVNRGPAESELANLARLLRRDWKIVVATTALVTLGAVAQVLFYRADPRYVSDMMLLLYSSKSTDLEVASTPQVLTTQRGNLETEITLMRSQSLVSQAIQYLPSDPQGNTLTVEEVLSNLSIKQAGGTGVLTLSYIGASPVEAEAVLNSLAKAYISYSLSRQQSEATRGIRLIERKLPETGLALSQAAENLQRFRQTYRLKDPENLSDQVIGQQNSFENRYRETLIAYDKALSDYNTLGQQLIGLGQRPQIVSLYLALSQDEIYNGLRQKHAQLQVDYEINQARFSEINPLVEELAAERDSLKRSMDKRAQQLLGDNARLVDLEAVSAYGSSSPISALATNLLTAQRQMTTLNAELRNLEATLTDLDGVFQKVPRLQRQYFDLTREFTTQDRAMDSLLESLQNLQISEAQDSAPWEVLQPPSFPKQVPDPKVPSLPRNLVLGLLGGLFLGSSVALLRDRLDNTFHSPEQIKEQTNLPLLGVIPLREEGALRERYATGSVFSEAFRSLHTSLRLLRPDRPLRSLVVTSPTSGDGKSTVAAELAMAAASMGRRVLLVDLDLRRPSQGEFLGLSSRQGFTTLMNADTELESLLHTRANTPDLARKLPDNLTVLLSGPRPPDPTQLLSSDKAQAWLQSFQGNYDLVIYDAPPLGGLADSLLIGSATDGLVLVCRIERTQRSDLYQALDSLRASNMSVLGVVANGYALSGRYAQYYYGPYNNAELAEENLDLARLIHRRLKKDRAKQSNTLE